MSVGPVKSLAAGFTALGLMATGPLTGNAYSQEARPIQINVSSEGSPIVRAGNFSEADGNNVAIMMYFGRGNQVTPDQVGQALIGRLDEAADRANYEVDADYFYMITDRFEGISIDFAMGGVSIDGVDVRDALARPSEEQPTVVMDQVIQKRIDVNRTLNMASLER